MVHPLSWHPPHKEARETSYSVQLFCQIQGTSLNDHLLSGPDMLNNLSGVLIRFLTDPVALICDIEKLFHQFHVEDADRNYLRFLWWKQGDLNLQSSEFSMKVDLLSAASSPGYANFGLKYLAKNNADIYP